MNILLSNDDGLMANGIRALTEALSCEHDVYVIAIPAISSSSSEGKFIFKIDF